MFSSCSWTYFATAIYFVSLPSITATPSDQNMDTQSSSYAIHSHYFTAPFLTYLWTSVSEVHNDHQLTNVTEAIVSTYSKHIVLITNTSTAGRGILVFYLNTGNATYGFYVLKWPPDRLWNHRFWWSSAANILVCFLCQMVKARLFFILVRWLLRYILS